MITTYTVRFLIKQFRVINAEVDANLHFFMSCQSHQPYGVYEARTSLGHNDWQTASKVTYRRYSLAQRIQTARTRMLHGKPTGDWGPASFKLSIPIDAAARQMFFPSHWLLDKAHLLPVAYPDCRSTSQEQRGGGGGWVQSTVYGWRSSSLFLSLDYFINFL